MYNDKNTGMPVIKRPETIILDYGGPNIAKPLHIGHLRSAIIGESLKHILRYAGYDVISDVHIGDWGLPMGLSMAEFKVRNPEWLCFSDNFNSKTDLIPDINVNELNEIYPYASNKSKTDEEFLKLAKDITYKN